MPAYAVDNPWVGTWKLDPARSQFTGRTFIFSAAPSGMMHFTDRSTIAYDFRIDGKDYPIIADRAIRWTASGENAWDTVVTMHGAELARQHYAVSPDGKTLTITYTGKRPDNSALDADLTYTRQTGANGLAGRWRSSKVTISSPGTYIVSAKGGGVLQWQVPEYKEVIEGKPNGADLTVNSPILPPGVTAAFRRKSRTTMSYVAKLKGKPLQFGIQTLAPDGHSFTDVNWTPGRADEKITAFYVRQ